MKTGLYPLLGLLLLTGCEILSRDRTYEILLPDPPPGYGFLCSWDALIIGDDGGEERIVLSGSDRSFVFTGLRERRYLVLVYAVGPSPFRMRPAGLFLDGRSGVPAGADFFRGPALLLLAEAIRSGFDIRRFNCGRFIGEWEDADSPSPWFLDRDRALTSLLEGDFSVRDLRQGALFPYTPAADGLPWASEDALLGWEPPAFLPRGTFRFYCPDLSRFREVSLDREGRISVLEYSVKIP